MNIHESMLCRWVGYDVENAEYALQPAPRRKQLKVVCNLSNSQIEKYLSYLQDALDPNKGLFVSPFADFDRAGTVESVAPMQPCLFFTELAASASLQHSRVYGRLGFALSKKFVFQQGGRPVIYTTSSTNKSDPIIAALDILRKTLRGTSPSSRFALEKWAQFLKITNLPTIRRQSKKKSTRRAAKVKKKNSAFPKENVIRFLGEREWRLLQTNSRNRLWVNDKKTLWFRPELGKELQLIIVPNNQVLELAYKSSNICNRLRGKSGVSAQILSLEAIKKL